MKISKRTIALLTFGFKEYKQSQTQKVAHSKRDFLVMSSLRVSLYQEVENLCHVN